MFEKPEDLPEKIEDFNEGDLTRFFHYNDELINQRYESQVQLLKADGWAESFVGDYGDPTSPDTTPWDNKILRKFEGEVTQFPEGFQLTYAGVDMEPATFSQQWFVKEGDCVPPGNNWVRRVVVQVKEGEWKVIYNQENDKS